MVPVRRGRASQSQSLGLAHHPACGQPRLGALRRLWLACPDSVGRLARAGSYPTIDHEDVTQRSMATSWNKARAVAPGTASPKRETTPGSEHLLTKSQLETVNREDITSPPQPADRQPSRSLAGHVGATSSSRVGASSFPPSAPAARSAVLRLSWPSPPPPLPPSYRPRMVPRTDRSPMGGTPRTSHQPSGLWEAGRTPLRETPTGAEAQGVQEETL
jgi:hypothetical protein